MKCFTLFSTLLLIIQKFLCHTHGLLHVISAGNAFSGNIKRGSVINGSTDDRKSDSAVYTLAHELQLRCNMSLIMIHGNSCIIDTI